MSTTNPTPREIQRNIERCLSTASKLRMAHEQLIDDMQTTLAMLDRVMHYDDRVNGRPERKPRERALTQRDVDTAVMRAIEGIFGGEVPKPRAKKAS